MSETKTPMVRWAQRKDNIFFSIELPEVTGETAKLDGNKFHFEGTSQGQKYLLDIEFNKDVQQEGTSWAKHGKTFNVCVSKKEEGFWPKLTAGSGKQSWLSVDWSKWVDSDEEADAPEMDYSQFGGGGGMGGMDMGGMGGMGGMDMSKLMGSMGGMNFGGMGGGDDDEEEEEDMPGLEEVK